MSIYGNSVGHPLPNPRKGMDMTGSINMNGHQLGGLAEPVKDSDAASKGYVDNAIKLILAKYMVTLFADGWADNLQKVSVDFATSSNTIFASPDPAYYDLYTENGVIAAEQADGSVTFRCESVPGADIIVNLAIFSPLPEVQKEPVAYLYNGVELPALPVEDTEKYPYVFLYTYNSRTYLNYHAHRPFFSYIRNEAGEFCVVNPNASYALENGAFTDRRENDRSNIVFNHTEDKLQLIWTNFDVLNDDGSVYMAAGYTNYPDAPPVPAETITDPCPDKSVMYLYDDASTDEVGDTVELPAIPEVDLRVYPYLWVRYAYNKYSLMMSRHPIWYGSDRVHYSYCYSQESDNLNEWTYLGKHVLGYPSVWANYDVYDAYDFDRVAISASDPVPIYE